MKEPQTGLAARQAALDILGEVLRRRRPLDAALSHVLSAVELPPRDAGFARAIASETLRRLGQLEALIRHFVPKAPPPHKAGPTLELLMAGACELLFLNVPAHAAVDAANRLAAKDAKAKHFKPLINAVLRRVAREGQEVIAQQDAARLNTPDWLWPRWCETYGEEIARALAAAHLRPAPLDLMTKTPVAIEGAITLPGGVLRLHDASRIDALPGYAEGAWWVQDFAATQPARLLGEVCGTRVIDLCAAPGGKTAELVALGAQVTAVERDAERLARLKENLARLHLEAECVEADLRDYVPETPAPFVLLDAPCSATGTIRRHPELPWIKSAADATQCADAAAELLDAAAEMVAPGGTLVFAVCSLEAEEGPEQVASFLARNDGFARIRVFPSEVFGMSELINADGDLRTLPCHLAEEGGMDGFYAARLNRLR
ncbi:MAG: MFS transporter [Pseudomonadota bacterium]|nr:MFS transporter [Pseudomonadota bacterium]